MLASAVAAVLARDLGTLRREIEAYPDDRLIWRTVPGITNTAGTLALHLAGNVQHFVGATLGRSGYRRDRQAEFARRDVPRAELLREVSAAETALDALHRLSETQLRGDYPEIVGGSRVAAGEFLVHLVAHFTYHLGQIDYHRRVVTGQATPVGAVQTAGLTSADWKVRKGSGGWTFETVPMSTLGGKVALVGEV